MIILGNFCGDLSLFTGLVRDFVYLAHPTSLWFVGAQVEMFVFCHIFLLYHTKPEMSKNIRL